MSTPEIFQEQIAELNFFCHMFPEKDEVVMSQELEKYLINMNQKSSQEEEEEEEEDKVLPIVSFQIHLKRIKIQSCYPYIEITYPRDYPQMTPQVRISCFTIPKEDLMDITKNLVTIAEANVGEPTAFLLLQEAMEFLQTYQEEKAPLKLKEKSDSEIESITDSLIKNVQDNKEVVTVGRRAVYCHHIINKNKRKVIIEWANELDLSGCSKIGWPGVIVVEGKEDSVREYIARLQQLRWKHFVVRGEQTEQANHFMEMLKFSKGWIEFDEHQMSDIAEYCKKAGVLDLFLTVMKIY